jgi:hypothetical protein
MNPVAGGSGPELEYSGAPVTSGEFGAWTPIGAEATSTVYELARKTQMESRLQGLTGDVSLCPSKRERM